MAKEGIVMGAEVEEETSEITTTIEESVVIINEVVMIKEK